MINYPLLDILVYYSAQCKCNYLNAKMHAAVHQYKQIYVSLKDSYILLYISRNGVNSVLITDSLKLLHKRVRGEEKLCSDVQGPLWLVFSTLGTCNFSLAKDPLSLIQKSICVTGNKYDGLVFSCLDWRLSTSR